MSYMRFVCLFASTLVAAAVLMAVAQSPTLQQGVSVQMAVTSNAASTPEADDNDAWIVTVTADGSLYFGTDPVTRNGLVNAMTRTPRRREQKLYIKADARAAYAGVEKALDAASTAEFATTVLLTSQPGQAAPGTMVPPKGLEVLVGPALPTGTVATVVQLFNSGQQRPTLNININDDQIRLPALRSALTQHFQQDEKRVVLVKADGQLPFADVANVIDICRSAGAKIVLAGTSL
jgi:biopolymer transport protein ExbD